jgi:Flp pilus assembly pilin Flp
VVFDDWRGWVRAFVVDEGGQDLIEYALLSGIVGAAGALLIPPIVTGMRTSYVAWQTGVRDAWEPCAPGASPCP